MYNVKWRDMAEVHREEAKYAMRCALLVSDDPLLRACVNKLLTGEGLTPAIAKAWAKALNSWRGEVALKGLTFPDSTDISA